MENAFRPTHGTQPISEVPNQCKHCIWSISMKYLHVMFSVLFEGITSLLSLVLKVGKSAKNKKTTGCKRKVCETST